MKGQEKQRRAEIVKGTADVTQKQTYLKLKEKVAKKEKQIEEAKLYVDEQIERRRHELGLKNSRLQPISVGKEQIEKERQELMQRNLLRDQHISQRIIGQKELRAQENAQKAELAQLRREQAKLRAQEDLGEIMENKRRIAIFKLQQREQVLLNKAEAQMSKAEVRHSQN